MNIRKLEGLLKKVKSGKSTIDEAISQLKSLPFEDLGFTRIDHHRSLRKGYPEVIWGEGKTSHEILSILKQLKAKGQNILITRVEEEKAKEIQRSFPKCQYFSRAKVLTYLTHPVPPSGKGMILVITAGTTDIGVAEEAAKHACSCVPVAGRGGAELAGQPELARANYARLLELTERADGNRPEIKRAREFVASR